jgi:hypothetical protein
MPPASGRASAFDRHLDREPGLAHLVDEEVERGEAGLRRERQPVAGGAKHPEQPAHLDERVAADLLDRPQDLVRRPRLGRQRAALGPRLEDDHRHVVGDHVMQLARDAGPLLDHRLARAQLLLALEQASAELAVADDLAHEDEHEHGHDGEEHHVRRPGRPGEPASDSRDGECGGAEGKRPRARSDR